MSTQPDAVAQSHTVAPATEDHTEKTSARPMSTPDFSSLLEKIIDQGVADGYVRQVVDSELSRSLFDQDKKLATIFAQSGAFDDIKGSSPVQSIALAMTKIQLGRSWGMAPADAMRFVNLTNGRPSVESDYIASRLKEHGYDWDIQWYEDQTKRCIGCTLWIKTVEKGVSKPLTDRDGHPVSVSFTKTDADNATYYEKGEWKKLSDKWNYKSWPRDMYYSRCITRLRRYYAPHVLRGAVTKQEAEEFLTTEQMPDESQQVMTQFGVTGIPAGTVKAAEAVAEAKIAQMETARQRKGFLPGETDEQRAQRQEAQFASELAAAKLKEDAQKPTESSSAPEPSNAKPSEAPTRFKETFSSNKPLPDAELVPLGSTAKYDNGDGRIHDVTVTLNGDIPEWRSVGSVPVEAEKPTQETQQRAPRNRPQFGKRS